MRIEPLQIVIVVDQEGKGLDAKQRLLADLLHKRELGHRYSTVLHRPQQLRTLLAKRTAGVHDYFDLAARDVLDFRCELHGVLCMKIPHRPDDSHVQLLPIRRYREPRYRQTCRQQSANSDNSWTLNHLYFLLFIQFEKGRTVVVPRSAFKQFSRLHRLRAVS